MIIAWIIGLILSILGISFLKNSRTNPRWGQKEKPILRLWAFILFIIGAALPIFNVFMGIIIIIWWAIMTYCEKDWVYTKQNSKLIKFLNKPIG